jgi:hypothetical protein
MANQTDDLLEAIKTAEGERALRQVAADQARDHRDHLIRDAIEENANTAVIASAANLSVADVEAIRDFT